MRLALAFMHVYSMFNLRLFLSILLVYIFKNKSGIERPDRNGQWYQHVLTLFAFFFFFKRAVQKRQTVGLCFHVLRLCNVHALYCIQLV